MQEHPVPQNITSYEFHLIGNMTLKQFFELLVGGLLAFTTYSSNLPFIIKTPLILFSVFGGIALAFIPIEERPLDHWLLSFLKAIYNPTKFYWKKTIKIPDVFSNKKLIQQPLVSGDATATSKEKKVRAQAYFQSIQEREDASDELQNKANAVIDLFNNLFPQTQQRAYAQTSVNTLPMAPQTGFSGVIQVPEPVKPVKTALTPDQQFPISHLVKSKGNVVVLKQQDVHIQLDETVTSSAVKSTGPFTYQQFLSKSKGLQQQTVTTPTKTTSDVKMNIKLPFPKTPTKPNLVVGMALDSKKKIVENAIVEIQNSAGIPVRALKTNMLGQFFATTPLPAGEYAVIAEKDGLSFQPQKLTVKGKIIAPLEIQATE